jgi:glycosyltransferase involved in cell wall biosynthesis
MTTPIPLRRDSHERTDALPDGFAFVALSELARRNPVVAAGLREDATDRDAGLAWFRRIDSLLRAESANGEFVDLIKAFSSLHASDAWAEFMDAVVSDAQRATEMRMSQGRLRALWGTTPIISLIAAVQADRRIGIEAESVVFTTYHVTKNFDVNLSSFAESIAPMGMPMSTAMYLLILTWTLISFDIFHYYNDRGVLTPEESTGRFFMGIRQEEMALLRRASKFLYPMPYGADYRTRERTLAGSRFNFCMDCPTIGGFCFCNDQVWPIVFHTIGAYATAVLGSGLALGFFPNCYRLDYVVVDTDVIAPSYSALGPKLKVLHVPNHQHFKGTRYLKEAIARLPAGAPVEFMMASGISNSEVFELMRGADVVVDQLIGGYFGLTAIEAMAHGKPVIVYIANWDTVIAPDECPLISANPDTIQSVLENLVANPSILPELGRRSRAYVEKHYSIDALAGRLRKLYADTAGLEIELWADALPHPLRVGGAL